MKGKVQKGTKANDAPVSTVYAGGSSNVAKEAHNKAEGFKRGGKAHKGKHHMEHKLHGAAAKAHAGRKPRKSGGGVLSSAASGSTRPGFKGYVS